MSYVWRLSGVTVTGYVEPHILGFGQLKSWVNNSHIPSVSSTIFQPPKFHPDHIARLRDIPVTSPQVSSLLRQLYTRPTTQTLVKTPFRPAQMLDWSDPEEQ